MGSVHVAGPAHRPTLVVTGHLGDEIGGRLAAVCDEALKRSPTHLEIDLCAVTSADLSAQTKLSRCVAAARSLPDGVGIRVSSAVGRRVLLGFMSGV